MSRTPQVLHQSLFLHTQGVADQHRLPVGLVRAIVMVESGGDWWAWRPEPPYQYLWDVKRGRPFRPLTAGESFDDRAPRDFQALKGSRDAEFWGQQASWGPMQVMGAVAREAGFVDHFPKLCDPYTGVRYGCVHLAGLRDRFLVNHGWAGVAAAYNAGTPRLATRRTASEERTFVNQAYVDKVRAAGGFVGLENRA
jgi:hypothetical protein